MKFMVFGKATPDTEAGVMPTSEEIAEMGEFNEQLMNAGMLVDGGGLKASRHGVRISYDDDGAHITDGPFTEVKEIISGFAIWEADSMEEAVEGAKKAPLGNGEECEIRPFITNEELGIA